MRMRNRGMKSEEPRRYCVVIGEGDTVGVTMSHAQTMLQWLGDIL